MLAASCIKNGDMPIAMISLMIRRSGRKFRSRNLSTLALLKKWLITQTAVTNWEITVASADPAIPNFKPNSSSGFKIVFNTAAISIVAIARRGLPSALIMLLIPKPTCIKTLPAKIIPVNVRAYGSTSDSAPRATSSGSSQIRPIADSSSDSETISVRALPRICSAAAWSRSPSRIETMVEAPMPTSMPKASITSITGKAMVTAVRPISPTP